MISAASKIRNFIIVVGNKKIVCIVFCLVALLPNFVQCRTIHIPKDYETIQEGIDEAKKGDTIFVSNGNYYENLRMKDGLILEGQDSELTIITDSGQGPPNPVVQLSCNCTLKNVTVTGARGAGIGHAVVVLGGNPRILNNIIRDNNYTGIGIHSEVDKVSAYIRGNKIYANGGAGISSLGSSVDSIILNNHIYANNNLGVVVLDNATMRVRNNEIRENGVGIVSKTGGKAYVEKNIIEGNKTVGIVVKEKAFAQVDDNELIKNGTPGINVDNATANLFNNRIRGNGTIGIYYKNKSKGIIDENEITSLIPNLILIHDSELSIKNNKIIGSEGIENTITIKNSKVEFENNRVVGGIKTDEVTKIKLSKPYKKISGTGCLSFF